MLRAAPGCVKPIRARSPSGHEEIQLVRRREGLVGPDPQPHRAGGAEDHVERVHALVVRGELVVAGQGGHAVVAAEPSPGPGLPAAPSWTTIASSPQPSRL